MDLKRKSLDIYVNFFKDFDEVRPKMVKILSEMEIICGKTKERKKDLGTRMGAAAAAGAAAGAVEAVEAVEAVTVLTGGVTLLIAGAGALAGAVAGAGAVVVRDKITDKETLDKVKELVQNFCDTVQHLKDVHAEKKDMINKLDRKVEDVVIHLSSLIEQLWKLFIDFRSNSTVQRLLEVTQQCRTILQELDELKMFFESDSSLQQIEKM